MSRVLKVSEGNYRVKVQSGGRIYLDTGELVGDVYITGNLTVLGTQTTVESTNTVIADNTIILNNGEQGPGITLSTAGIRIDRGQRYRESIFDPTPAPYDAEILFDENVSHYNPISDSSENGTFVLRTANGALSGLRLASISPPDSYDMVFDMQNSLTKLRIENIDPFDYARLLDATLVDVAADTPEDNFIPNKKYVSNYVSATGGTANVDNFHYIANPSYTYGKALLNYIEFKVASQIRATITTLGLNVDNLNFYTNTIKNNADAGLDKNLILTANNNQVEINAVLNLDNQTLDPADKDLTTRIYSKGSEGPGRSGIYFVNDTPYGALSYNRDELVSKNRAVLLSILL